MRANRLLRSAALAVLVAVAAPVAFAGDKDFDVVVKHLEARYKAKKRESLPFFARVAIKFVKPAGVKSFKLTTLDGLEGQAGGDALDALLRSKLHESWRPLVRVYSKREREQVFIYARPSKKDLELLVVAVDDEEATVVKAKVDPERASDLVDGTILASR
jgi:hypothetical protein